MLDDISVAAACLCAMQHIFSQLSEQVPALSIFTQCSANQATTERALCNGELLVSKDHQADVPDDLQG